MSHQSQPQWARYLKPAFMDRLLMSVNWLPNKTTNQTSNKLLPYEHPRIRELLQSLGYDNIQNNSAAPDGPGVNPHVFDDAYADHVTRLWIDEVREAWEDVQSLTRRDPRTGKESLNVDIITTVLETFSSDQLNAVVNASWSEVAQMDRFGGMFGKESTLPPFRNADVIEYLRICDGFKEDVKLFEGDECTVHNVVFHKDTKATAEHTRQTFMIPFLNQHDLGNWQFLRCLILNRILEHPRKFARADWEGCHLGRATKRCLPFFCDNRFMGFPTQGQLRLSRGNGELYSDYIAVFQKPTVADTECTLFKSLQETGLIFGWGEGMMVLVIQAATLRFVKAVAGKIMDAAGGLGLTHTPGHKWDSVPTELRSFDVEVSGIVGCGQFFPASALPQRWNTKFARVLRDRLDLAKTHLQRLRHDPFYFRQHISMQYSQHYGHVAEAPSNSTPEEASSEDTPMEGAPSEDTPMMDAPGIFDGRLPHMPSTDIDAKRALVNDLIRRVVRWAIFQVEIWQCLLEKLENLCKVAHDHMVVLDLRDERPEVKGKVKKAWVDLGYHARYFAYMHIIHLNHGGFLASSSVRDYARRGTRWEDLRSQAPKQEWVLPKGLMDHSIDFKATQQNEVMVDDEKMQSAINFFISKHCSTIGVALIGLDKLIQKMRSDKDEVHPSIEGVQQMVQDDYDAIFWMGLLSQQMEALHPFGDAIPDLGDSAGEDGLRCDRPIWSFLEKFDKFDFENTVSERTLTEVHGFLGVAYVPRVFVGTDRPSEVVQQWLAAFWTEVTTWLTTERDENNNNAGGGGVDGMTNGGQLKEQGGHKNGKKNNNQKRIKDWARAHGQGKVTKPPKKDSRPPAFLKYLGELEKSRGPLDRPIFEVSKICGIITTLEPISDTERQAAERKQKSIDLCKKQTWGNYDRKLSRMPQGGPGQANILRKADWRTMEIVFASGKGSVTSVDFFHLCKSLGLAIDPSSSGCRTKIKWTTNSLFPKPKNCTIGFHAPHRLADTLKDNVRVSLKHAFASEFNITERTIRGKYRCQGT